MEGKMEARVWGVFALQKEKTGTCLDDKGGKLQGETEGRGMSEDKDRRISTDCMHINYLKKERTALYQERRGTKSECRCRQVCICPKNMKKFGQATTTLSSYMLLACFHV